MANFQTRFDDHGDVTGIEPDAEVVSVLKRPARLSGGLLSFEVFK